LSENRKIARAAGVVSGLTLLSRVTGLARDVVVGYLFGTGAAADAFFVAFRIPNLLRRLVAEGTATVAFIPVFTEYLTNRPRAEALEVARITFTTMAVILGSLTLAGVLLADPLTRLFAPGFAVEPGKMKLAVSLTRMVFPYIFFVGLVAIAMGVLNAMRHFVTPALSPALLNLAIIVAALTLSPWLGVYSLGLGVLVGGLMQVLVQVPPLRRRGVSLAPSWQPVHPALSRIGRLMLPTLFGAAVYQFNVLADTVFASLLPAGSVSYLWYADRLFEFPLGVFAAALGTAVLPSFASLAKKNDLTGLRHSLGFALRLVNLIAIPAAVGLAAVADPITALLFQRGSFGPQETVGTALAVRMFAVGLWSVASVRVLVPVFYALEDTRTPVMTATGAFCCNLVFILLLMGKISPNQDSAIGTLVASVVDRISLFDLRHGGLALATSLSATVNLALLALALRSRVGALRGLGLARSFCGSLAAALLMVPVVSMIAAQVSWTTGDSSFWVRAAVLLLAIGSGIATFLLASLLTNRRELVAAAELMRRRLARQ